MTNHRKAGKMLKWCFGLMITSSIIYFITYLYMDNYRVDEDVPFYLGLIIAIAGLVSSIFGFYGGILLSKEDI
jgi:hypothetical protein